MPKYLEIAIRLLLGQHKEQRASLTLNVTAFGIYAFSLLAQAHSVARGFAQAEQAWWLTAAITAVQCTFYALIRSGFSRRFGEPGLVLPQMAFGIVALALAYLINPHVRGMLLMVVALVLSYGSFTLPPGQCRGMGWFAVAALGLAMAVGALLDAQRFSPEIEAIHFAFAAAVLPTLSYLAATLSRIRHDLRRQRQELREALERLNRVATLDELTGLPNRRYVLERIPHEAGRCLREGKPLCVAIVDIDHFKRINDTLGHSAGDEVLRMFALEAQRALRTGDTLARWGGEEFLLLMPACTVEQAQAVVERVREQIGQVKRWVELLDRPVTFSAGVARFEGLASLDTTLRRADAALYAAKHQGRDRIVAA